MDQTPDAGSALGGEADYRQLWDDLFRARPWGRYPPEDLVRFVSRRFAGRDRASVKVLEVGCGPGANVWFLHREGYRTAAIDFSPAAIEQARARIAVENAELGSGPVEFHQGDLSVLPFPDAAFDLVIDVFALCCNPSEVIRAASGEIRRVLRPDGAFYTKTFGPRTSGSDKGERLPDGTFVSVDAGPLADMGVIRFSDEADLGRLHGDFARASFDSVLRTDSHRDCLIEEVIGMFEAGGEQDSA